MTSCTVAVAFWLFMLVLYGSYRTRTYVIIKFHSANSSRLDTADVYEWYRFMCTFVTCLQVSLGTFYIQKVPCVL